MGDINSNRFLLTWPTLCFRFFWHFDGGKHTVGQRLRFRLRFRFRTRIRFLPQELKRNKNESENNKCPADPIMKGSEDETSYFLSLFLVVRDRRVGYNRIRSPTENSDFVQQVLSIFSQYVVCIIGPLLLIYNFPKCMSFLLCLSLLACLVRCRAT